MKKKTTIGQSKGNVDEPSVATFRHRVSETDSSSLATTQKMGGKHMSKTRKLGHNPLPRTKVMPLPNGRLNSAEKEKLLKRSTAFARNLWRVCRQKQWANWRIEAGCYQDEEVELREVVKDSDAQISVILENFKKLKKIDFLDNELIGALLLFHSAHNSYHSLLTLDDFVELVGGDEDALYGELFLYYIKVFDNEVYLYPRCEMLRRLFEEP